MRIEKLTTKFQEALGEAQSLALGNDHQYIEAPHLLLAMLRQDDGPKALLQRAGVNAQSLHGVAEAALPGIPLRDPRRPPGGGRGSRTRPDHVLLIRSSPAASPGV